MGNHLSGPTHQRMEDSVTKILTPKFKVGLIGDWGAGKSTFARLINQPHEEPKHVFGSYMISCLRLHTSRGEIVLNFLDTGKLKFNDYVFFGLIHGSYQPGRRSLVGFAMGFTLDRTLSFFSLM